MTDRLSERRRSENMSRVRGADTRPEWILRCALHRLGFRYRLGNRKLPGRPDLVFPKYRAVVFVHGCYWHRHPGCKNASTPKSNTAFWRAKFAENVARDRRNEQALAEQGWRVMAVWECELTDHTTETIRKVAQWLTGAAGDDGFRYDTSIVQRDVLLAMADKKVRYRIDAYDEQPDSSGASKAKRR